jgi:O-antigen/teichoic acid export membrane protein
MSVYELRPSIETSMIPSSVSETRQTGDRTRLKIETAIKFVVLAIPGFLIFVGCCLGLIIELSYGEPFTMDPPLAPILALVGALMILGGTGQWGRWAYLCVFLSIPTTGLVWAMVFKGDSFPDPLTTYPKLLGMAVFALPMIGSYAIVNRYYSRKALRKSEFVPSTETSQARRQN